MYAQQLQHLQILHNQMAQIEPRMKAYLDAALQKITVTPREAPTVDLENRVTRLETALQAPAPADPRLETLETRITKLETGIQQRFTHIDAQIANFATLPPSPTAASLNLDDIVIEERKKTKRGGGGAAKKAVAPMAELECA